MPLLTVSSIRHAYGTHVVLDGATFSMEPGEKVGLVGRNGCGKSTLMRIVEGVIKPDAGAVQVQRGMRVGYLSQEPVFDRDETLREAAEGAFADLHQAHRELHQVFDAMASAEGEALERLLRRQADLELRIESLGGYAIDHRIDATLHGLGFTDAQFSLQTRALSGGQRSRLGLARLLLEEPDLLLLDEPTNHLDIAGREWLENFLADEYHGAVLVVSHDRWLLDRVVSRIIEVERGAIREYPGNYHKYLELRRERQLTQSRDYDKQLDRVKAEEAFIMRYKAGQRAKQARGRATRLERFKADMAERPVELEVMTLRLPKSPRVGDTVLTAEGLSKRYGEKVLFEGLDLRVAPGDRIGIIGPNGAGKTTLVRTLLGELPADSGSVRVSSRAAIGYLRQTHDHLDPDLLVWEYLQRVITSNDAAARASEQQARDLAGAFLFSGRDQEKHVGLLSGGEKMRMVLAGLMASEKNLIVLDEPTNHLDIPSAERLEEALGRDPEEGGYDGAMLLISHDRALLESTCDRLVVLDGAGGVRVFEGSFSAWHEQENARRRQAEAQARAAAEAETKRRAAENARKQQASKPASRTADPFAKLSLTQIEERIEKAQARLRAIDEEMIDPAVYTDARRIAELQAERDRLAAELEPLEFEWSRRADEG